MTLGVMAAVSTSGEGESVLGTVEGAAVLLALAVLVAVGARRLNIPYSVALVLVGLGVALAAPALGIAFTVTPELVLAVFLPGLVFEASYAIDATELRRSFGGVLILAVPGVLVSAGIVAVVLNVATGLPLDLAFVVGAIVSATDPVAVVAMFRRLGAPRRLTTLVEAESLFNDGTAIVVFAIALEAIQHGISPGDAILSFAITVVVSAVIGTVAGVAASWVIARVNDHLVELTISVLLAYGTYLLADRLGQSGIIATVVAGVTLGTTASRFGMPARTRESLDLVWEFLAFVLNALVFLLIGVSVSIDGLGGALPAIAWGVVAILIGRALVVYGLLGIPARLAHTAAGSPAIPLAWLHVLFWAGLRGAVAVALALSLPVDLPQRSLLQGIVYGIVLFTLIVQGSTAELVIRRTGVREGDASTAPGDASAAGTPTVPGEPDPASLVRSSVPESQRREPPEPA